MRGIAAFMVVLHHAWLTVEQAASQPSTLLQRHLIGLGASGVDIFFAISGLIMIYTGHRSLGRPGAAGHFLARRAIRIVPMYWLLSGALLAAWMTGLMLRHTVLTGGDLACSFLFMPCVQPHGVQHTTHPLLDPGWTLSYEWYFYLVFCCWLATGSLRKLVWGTPLLFCVIIACASRWPNPGTVADFFADPLVFEFCFGLTIGWLVVTGYLPSRATGSTCIIAGTCLLLTSCLQPATPPPPRWLAWGAPAALIVLGALSLQPLRSRPGRALVALGDSSYSLYLSHGLVIMVFAWWLRRHPPAGIRQTQWFAVMAVCAAAVILGLLIHRLLEVPVTESLRHWYEHRRRRPGTLAVSSRRLGRD